MQRGKRIQPQCTSEDPAALTNARLRELKHKLSLLPLKAASTRHYEMYRSRSLFDLYLLMQREEPVYNTLLGNPHNGSHAVRELAISFVLV